MEKCNLNIKIKGHAGLYFWMQRVAEEHRNKATELIKKSDTLHWQTVNFESMRDEVKEEVIKEVVGQMIDFGWHKNVDELSKSHNNQKNKLKGVKPNSSHD